MQQNNYMNAITGQRRKKKPNKQLNKQTNTKEHKRIQIKEKKTTLKTKNIWHSRGGGGGGGGGRGRRGGRGKGEEVKEE